MYKKAFARRIKGNKHLIHLWTDEGYEKVEWDNQAYIECPDHEATFTGLNGESLKKTKHWNNEDSRIHFGDMPAHQKFLIEKYGIDDTPSTTHRELFFDIECEMGDALTPEYIQSAPKRITSIAWYDKQMDQWGIVILDEKKQLKHTKTKKKKEIMFKCFHCGDDLRWNNDFDAEEDYEYLIVSMYECMNEECKAWYEIYHGIRDKEKPN